MELLETVIRERKNLDQYEARWDQAREKVVRDRGEAVSQPDTNPLDHVLDSINETQLRKFIKRLPQATVKRALETSEEE